MMDTLLGAVFLAAVAQNLVLDGLLGLCPAIALSQRHVVATGMALLALVVLPMYCLLAYAVRTWVLAPLGAETLTLITWVVLAYAISPCMNACLRQYAPGMLQRYGNYLPFFSVNCLVLGSVLLTLSRQSNLVTVLAGGVGTAMGYAIVLLLMASFRERLDMTAVPTLLRGVPIAVITLGILSLAVLGLRGVGT